MRNMLVGKSSKIKELKEYFHSRDEAIQFGRFYARENRLKLLSIKCLEPRDYYNASRMFLLKFRKLK